MPPKSGSITFFIFYEGGKGGCPAAGGKGERFCVPAVLSCDRNATDFSFTENSWRAGKTGGVQRASLYNDCFSRKPAGHKAEGAVSCFASLPFCPPFLERLACLCLHCFSLCFHNALLLRFLRAFQYMQTVWERMKRNEVQRNERAVCLLLLFFASEIIRPCGAETVCAGLTEQSVGAELY